MPVYKSFADLLVLLYTLAAHDIEIPFSVGNYEDTPRVKFIDTFLKGVGYIFAKRSRNQSLQEGYVNMALIREILNQ